MSDSECWPHDKSVERLMDKFHLSTSTLRTMMRLMTEMMDKGLSNDPQVKSSLKMLPTYVCALPDGTEQGDFVALDLGGTNFRVLHIHLHPNGKFEMDSKIYVVPKKTMTGTGIQLFDHLARCMAEFMNERGLVDRCIPVGFTFSFPCQQDGLSSARLLNWTKGFNCSGVVGEDVVRLLQDAAHRRHDVQMDVVAVVNDTVGTLMALAHEDPFCEIGVIMGTGTNACYMESIQRSPKLQAIHLNNADSMIINMEWGAFGDLGELDFIRTEFDTLVDHSSINPGRQKFEKMASGMYMGELVRLALLKLTKSHLLFDGHVFDELNTPNRFYCHYVSEIVNGSMADARNIRAFYSTRAVLTDFGYDDANRQDCANVAYVCITIYKRAAHMFGTGLAVLLNRIRKPKVTIGIDGSVYRFNQELFDQLLRQKIDELLEFPCQFKLKLSEDGSGRGAALVAAVAHRLKGGSGKGIKYVPRNPSPRISQIRQSYQPTATHNNDSSCRIT